MVDNDNAAHKWFLSNKKYFENNYEDTGHKKDYMVNIRNNTGMMYNKFLTIRKENDYNYRFYATKRKYVYWTLITLNVRMF